MVSQNERYWMNLKPDWIICVILSTVTAVTAIANIVKSSLGPVGLDKMLVDDIGVSFVAIDVFCQRDFQVFLRASQF